MELLTSVSKTVNINTTAITKIKNWSLFISNLNNFWIFVLSIYFIYHLTHKHFLESVVDKKKKKISFVYSWFSLPK